MSDNAEINARIGRLTEECERLNKARVVTDDVQQQLLIGNAEIRLNLAQQDKTLVKVVDAIEGNGKPGMKTRLDRVERNQAILGKLVWLILGAAVSAFSMWAVDHKGPTIETPVIHTP